MKRTFTVAVLFFLSVWGFSPSSIVTASQPIQLAQGQCSRRMGPYITYAAAEREARMYRNSGYNTSGVWGEGGIVSQWSNRRWYFNLFYRC